MKNEKGNIVILFLILAAVFLVVALSFAPIFGVKKASEWPTPTTIPDPPVTVVEVEEGNSVVVVDGIPADTARGMLQDAYEHDEAMADKIVRVAISGDVAQTTAAGLSWGGLCFIALIVGAVFVLLSALAKGDGSHG